MNINFWFLDNKSISQIAFPIRNIQAGLGTNNYTYRVLSKNIISFDSNDNTIITFKLNGYDNTRINIKYKLIFRNNINATIDNKPNKRKILIIRDIPDFDEITNKYGYIYENDGIFLDWRKLSRDYAGINIFGELQISPTQLLKKRFHTCIFNNTNSNAKRYTSWLENEVYTNGGYLWRQQGVIKDIQIDNIQKDIHTMKRRSRKKRNKNRR